MTSRLKRHAGVVLTVLALAITTLGMSSPAQAAGGSGNGSAVEAPRAADGRAPINYFGSIAMSPDQAYGGAYNYRTKAKAKGVAMRGCKRNSNYPGKCRSMGWVRNGCMAVAIKTNSSGWITAWASGYARNRAGAKRQAFKRLPGSGGRIRASVCTAR